MLCKFLAGLVAFNFVFFPLILLHRCWRVTLMRFSVVLLTTMVTLSLQDQKITLAEYGSAKLVPCCRSRVLVLKILKNRPSLL
jgi:hypothetical protein